jgi:glycosyltransferase involved in cell wall biosynthesis
MRLIYLSDAVIPSRASNSIQTMRMCDAFAAAGADLTLVHPRHRAVPPEGYQGDVNAFYGVRQHFARKTLRYFGNPAANDAGPLSRPLRALPIGSFFAWRSRPGKELFVCYTRSFLVAWIAARLRHLWGKRSSCRGVVLEVHGEPPSPSAWRLLEEVDGVVAISDALRERITTELPAIAARAWVEHDGADLGALHRDRLDQEAARADLDVPQPSGPVVVYTGRANVGKGVDVLIEAARLLERIGARVIVVGKVYEPDFIRRAGPNVTFTGFVPPSEVHRYLAAADALVMSTTEEFAFAAYTSPLKLFEYMASGRPVVASDLPVIREVLTDGQNALLYPSQSPHDLAHAIRRLWDDASLGSALAEHAWRDVQHYAWDERARRILRRLEGLT